MSFDEVSASYDRQVEQALPVGRHGPMLQAKADKLLELMERSGLEPASCRLGDIGCGIGLMAERLSPRVAELDGVDLSERSIIEARRRLPGARFTVYEGGRLPFEDGQFDVSFAVCVVHHVPPEEWSGFVGEMTRVTRGGGLVAILEHNPVNPLTRFVVSRCPFDHDAVLIRAGAARRLLREHGLEDGHEFILPTPWRDPISLWAERLFRRVPVGAQYMAYGVKPGARSG